MVCGGVAEGISEPPSQGQAAHLLQKFRSIASLPHTTAQGQTVAQWRAILNMYRYILYKISFLEPFQLTLISFDLSLVTGALLNLHKYAKVVDKL